MARNHEIRVRVTKEELERIEQKASKIGMLASTFLRVLGLSVTINPTECNNLTN